MILEGITELTIISINDRGIPNQERLAIQVNKDTDMGQYAVLIGVKAEKGFAYPINDNLYWFGDGQVSKGDWVFLYTGKGKPRATDIPNQNQKIYTIHWGRDYTILNDTNIVPILLRADGVIVPTAPE